jgi:hypothetical protein
MFSFAWLHSHGIFTTMALSKGASLIRETVVFMSASDGSLQVHRE